ncbi:5,6-dimethylbenzimidazole synthase [Vibrio mangrovi]|nr:5,6-dimethylbenzimidazole synthase [Vibrio mangrovi]MDW6004840.1 5,6-dimethylbenzimidazole synthase [Vibrio mangrovi]
MEFTPQDRETFYNILFSRRDVRSQFTSEPIDDAVLERILNAAHHAPSVGFMQPWDFIVVRSLQTRQAIKAGFEQAHHESALMFAEDKQDTYRRFKLEGIVEAPVGICVTCDRSRNGPVVIGRTIKPEMDRYSAVCAVQNMWLAARAENLGFGWVSILHDSVLRAALSIPEHLDILGYMCIGHVTHFQPQPELESAGWLDRTPLSQVVHYETWSE